MAVVTTSALAVRPRGESLNVYASCAKSTQPHFLHAPSTARYTAPSGRTGMHAGGHSARAAPTARSQHVNYWCSTRGHSRPSLRAVMAAQYCVPGRRLH